MRITAPLIAAAALLVAGCSGGSIPGGPATSRSTAQGAVTAAVGNATFVYTLNNQSADNRVLRFSVQNGALTPVDSFDTHGTGDPTIAGSIQSSIAVSGDQRFLFTVDAGSNEVTAFRVSNGTLTFADKQPAGGTKPVSLAVRGDLLYVLNTGSSSISGFRVNPDGTLTAIPHSTQPLSSTGPVGPAQIGFDETGRVLIVTEKATNKIDTFTLDASGVASEPNVQASAGKTPFGFAITASNVAIVSEAFGGAGGLGAATSYVVDGPGTLAQVATSVPDRNSAPCWIVITRDGRFAFASNTASATISTYAVDGRGGLSLTTSDGISAHTDAGPIDMALSPNDASLFVLNARAHTINALTVGTGGTLTNSSTATGLPAGAVGLAAIQATGL